MSQHSGLMFICENSSMNIHFKCVKIRLQFETCKACLLGVYFRLGCKPTIFLAIPRIQASQANVSLFILNMEQEILELPLPFIFYLCVAHNL